MLESNRILLRAPEPEDIDLLFQWENDRKLWDVSNTHAPYSKFTLMRFIETASMDIYEAKQLRLIICSKEDNAIFGSVDIFDFDPFHLRAGIGILIYNECDRQKGIASEAMDLVIDFCFLNIRMKQLYCNITSDNTASIALFKGKGFEVIGEKKMWTRAGDEWKNELLLQKLNLKIS